jgi:hypothetical protein
MLEFKQWLLSIHDILEPELPRPDGLSNCVTLVQAPELQCAIDEGCQRETTTCARAGLGTRQFSSIVTALTFGFVHGVTRE